MKEFKRADLDSFEDFIKYRDTAINEFKTIKTTFKDINKELLGKWSGYSSAIYKKMTDNIDEKVGGIEDTLNIIIDNLLVDVLNAYKKIDNEMAEFNLSLIE